MADDKNPSPSDAKKPAEASDDAGKKKAGKYAFHKRFAVVWALIICVIQFWSQGFDGMDNDWTDQMFRWRGVEQADERVQIVAIDDDSLEKIGQYPWPRTLYSKLLDALYSAGAEVVGLDIMFVDPSDSKVRGDEQEIVQLGPNDRALIEWTNKAGNKLVHAMNVGARGDQYQMDGSWEFEYPFFYDLKNVVKNFGFVSQPAIDPDGNVRIVPLMIGARDGVVHRRRWHEDARRQPVLGVKMLSIFEGKDADEYPKRVGGNLVRLNIRGEIPGHLDVRIDENDELVEYAVPARHGISRIPAWKLMMPERLHENENKLIRSQLKGSLVLVGSTALGAHDHYPTAFAGSTPGVETHANLIDNLLNDRYLRDAPRSYSIIPIVLFAFAAYWFVSLPALWAGLSFFLVLTGWIALNYLSFVHLHVLDFWAPAISLIGVFGVLMVHKTMLEQQQKKEVRNMFGQYVAPEIVDILVKDPGKLRLGGEKRDMTIFFLDIAHFTTISEKMTPENLILFLNRYLTALTDDILGSNGVVDKYIGDCIMAFWNAPLEVKDHREKACLAALGCIKTIKRLNDEYVDPSMPETPAVRIGLNSGEVVVGNTGSARKLAYTVLGDEVNLSSRLEGANKFFGSTIMASEDTYKGAKNAVEARRLGEVRVVGKDIPILVYELLAKKGELPKEWQAALPIYENAVDVYLKREFKKAKEGFEQVQKLVPGDKPSKLYLSSCEDYLVIPPPNNWDGVFNLTSK